MKIFRVLFAFDIGVAAVLGVVFCIGLADGIAARHIDREDLLLWPFVIAGLGGMLGGGWRLRALGRVRAANGVLLVIAVPSLIAGLVLLSMLASLVRPGGW